MAEIKKEPVVIALPALPKKKKIHGGLMPGELRGSRFTPTFREEKDDPDAEVLAKVREMDGPSMRQWLKNSGNKVALDKALAAKGKKR
jgi:hypothetical protein